MEYYSSIGKNEIMPFAATWMDLEFVILSEASQTKTNIIDIAYRVTEVGNRIMVTRGKVGERINWEVGVEIHTLLLLLLLLLLLSHISRV